MKRRLEVRPLAKQDLEEHFSFLAKDNEKMAINFLETVKATFQELTQFPEMGSRQELNNPHLVGLRKWRVRDFNKYLIFYRPLEESVEVLRVLYASRDIQSILEDAL